MRRGFQQTFTNDIYHIEERLQEYDEHLYIMYNTSTGEWLIMDGLIDHAIMKIPQIGFETLDARVVEHIKRIHIANGFSASQHVDANNEARQRDSDRKTADFAEYYAKESLEATRNLALYGRTDGYQKYVQGGVENAAS
ncbi:2,3-dihydroxybenzoate--AMP ligase [Brevibacillus brevis]|uniref:2,3-dihydroxybenzoate--AMP ligase n=1 Tax=Brevibacillus brevis TaxID=1393 RepID=UPI001901B2C0|nr:2,3-dihydroxybenzoate--AMP ligase [Brevibacillus brevis]MBH0328263.1 2,3-dihydroxybenzoate--AMP ligase [Brevibacillus brevis]